MYETINGKSEDIEFNYAELLMEEKSPLEELASNEFGGLICKRKNF